MQNGTRDVREQMAHNHSNYASGNPFGGTGETRYRPDLGTPLQNGGHHKGQLDILHKRGEKVNFPQDKLHGTENSKPRPSVGVEDFERLRADVDELLDAKDRLTKATPVRILEEIEKLRQDVNDTKAIGYQVTRIDNNLKKLLKSEDTLKELDNFTDKADKLRSVVNDFSRLSVDINYEVRNFYSSYNKVIELTQTTQRQAVSLESLGDRVGTLEKKFPELEVLPTSEDFNNLENLIKNFEIKLKGILSQQKKLETAIEELLSKRNKVISIPKKIDNRLNEMERKISRVDGRVSALDGGSFEKKNAHNK